jgi:hypothetical protein
MNVKGDDSAAVLYAAYLEQTERYARALRLASEVAAACGVGADHSTAHAAGSPGLRQVFALLDEIAAQDALLVPVKQHWESVGRPTTTALRAVMDRIAGLIRLLSRELQTIEQAARARREELAAELDVCNRRCQMQRAYQRKL